MMATEPTPPALPVTSTVLVSSGVRELLIGKGYVFVDLGRVELKGFEEPVAIYALHPGDDPQHRP